MNGALDVLGWICVIVLLWLLNRALSGKSTPNPFHSPTQAEIDVAKTREAEATELSMLREDSNIESQYKNKFLNMPYDSDFVDPECVAYLAREAELFYAMSKAKQKMVTKENSCNTANNFKCGWANYCSAFAGERMLRDRTAKPRCISYMAGGNPTKAAHPFEAAINKVWWFNWKKTHYPELIKKYNETGVFVPGWEWQPLDEVPDYHNNN